MCALVATALGVPRAVPPKEIPFPRIDRVEQRRARERERALAMEALRESLPYEVRAVGETFRRYGALRARGAAEAAAWELVDLKALVATARSEHGDPALLELRAVQSELFLEAVENARANGSSTSDLMELGGDFLERAQQRGWIVPGQAGISTDETRVFFQIRWGTLLGLLETHPFSPSLTDWRTYYSFLVRLDRPTAASGNEEVAAYRLGLVEDLSRRDPDYPQSLARGILLYQLGDYAGAADFLKGYLVSHRSGPWQLRAINALAASSAKLSGRL
jgi:hypothetical protein